MSKMYLRSRLRPEPHWGSFQRSSDPLAGGIVAPFPRTSPPLSAFGLEFRPFKPQESPQGFREQLKLLQRFRFTEKVEKHMTQ